MELTATDVKKQLYKSKAEAIFSHYVSGNLYYNVPLEDGTYQFPIETVEYVEIDDDPSDRREDEEDNEDMQLSSDLGTTPFNATMKGSDLNRWIGMAMKNDEFVKIA